MENTASHNKATRVILATIAMAEVDNEQGIVGLSLAARISERLENCGYLTEEALQSLLVADAQ